MLSKQKQIIEQARFTYSPLGKDLEKQMKIIENHGEEQVDALKSLESSDKQLPWKQKLNPKIIDEIKKNGKEKNKIDRSKMV